MEEESEKRKERLKAMRMEALQAGLNSDAGNSMGVPQSFTNPLIEPIASPSVPIDLHAPRFDFYTDPMAAFSANKRMSMVSHQNTPDHFISPRPRNPDLTPSSVHQYQTQINHSQDTRMFQGQGSSFNPPLQFAGPTGRPNPFGIHGNTNCWGGPSGPPTNQYPSNLPRAVCTPSPGFIQGGSPGFNYGQHRAQGFNNSPQGGSAYRGNPYSNIRRGNSPQVGFGNQGAPFPGRGRSGGNSSQAGYGNQGTPYPGRGRSGGRGRGSPNHVSAEERPDRYYNKSMMEDPWKMLKPVIWRGKCNPTSSATSDSDQSWLPKSIASKRGRVSEAIEKYKSKQSLAEYLAASFNEAVNESDEENVQESTSEPRL